MKSLLLVSVLALATAGFLDAKPVIGATNWANCDTALNTFEVETFELAPWPPSTNENVSMNITGTFTATSTIDALVINVYYENVSFYQVVLPRTGTFAKGTAYKDGYTAFFPTIAPPGNYAVKLQLRGPATATDYLNCLEVAFTL